MKIIKALAAIRDRGGMSEDGFNDAIMALESWLPDDYDTTRAPWVGDIVGL